MINAEFQCDLIYYRYKKYQFALDLVASWKPSQWKPIKILSGLYVMSHNGHSPAISNMSKEPFIFLFFFIS